MSIPGIERSQLGVLLIDTQPSFFQTAFPDGNGGREGVMVRLEHLLMLADWLELPVVATFEEPLAKNGELPDRLEAVFPATGRRFAKRTYDLAQEPAVQQALRALPVQQFAVAGAETDVCVMLSVLGLLRLGYQVFLLEDCLFSSEPHPDPALWRMVQAGAIPTTLKSLAYELVVSTERTPWYPQGWTDRERDKVKPFPEAFVPPEDWPAWEPRR